MHCYRWTTPHTPPIVASIAITDVWHRIKETEIRAGCEWAREDLNLDPVVNKGQGYFEPFAHEHDTFKFTKSLSFYSSVQRDSDLLFVRKYSGMVKRNI